MNSIKLAILDLYSGLKWMLYGKRRRKKNFVPGSVFELRGVHSVDAVNNIDIVDTKNWPPPTKRIKEIGSE